VVEAAGPFFFFFFIRNVDVKKMNLWAIRKPPAAGVLFFLTMIEAEIQVKNVRRKNIY